MTATLKTAATQLLRLKLSQLSSSVAIHSSGAPVCIHFTDSLWERRKQDVKGAFLEKYQRRMKKLNKELKQQMKAERIRKPLEEYEIRTWLTDAIASGQRVRKPVKYTEEELEAQVLLCKDWARYRARLYRVELIKLRRLEQAQQTALDMLREESEELYQQAIQIDEDLLNYNFKGPVYTPPIEGYETGDGDYIDETNYFEKQEKITIRRGES